MEFEKLKDIIAEVLNIDKSEITPDTTFGDLMAIPGADACARPRPPVR